MAEGSPLQDVPLFGGPDAGLDDPTPSSNPDTPTDACAAAPVATQVQIDNFEDANLLPFGEPGRTGFWGNSVLSLPEGERFSFEVTEGGADASDFAVEVVSSEGFPRSERRLHVVAADTGCVARSAEP